MGSVLIWSFELNATPIGGGCRFLTFNIAGFLMGRQSHPNLQARIPMTPYANLDGGSSIVSYELETDGIWVYFETAAYLWNYSKPGQEHVEAMKKLAVAGSGLNSYIMRPDIQRRYAKKIMLR